MNSLTPLVIVLGLVAGSFLNVCAYRIPREISVVYPPSRCIHCNHRLHIIDLIPVISYLLLKGKCRYCHGKISARYPLVEMLTALGFFCLYLNSGWTSQLVTEVIFFCGLMVCSLIDLEYQIIPDKVILLMLLTGTALLALQSEQLLMSGFIGGMVGFSVLLAIAIISRGGMGGGDVKLAAVLGLYLGWPKILLALMLAFFIGSLTGMVLMFGQKKSIKSAMPFAPHLGAAAMIALIRGEEIINWYLQMFID